MVNIRYGFTLLSFGLEPQAVVQAGVGSRVFDVSIEGQLVEDNLDVYAAVGADAMLVRTHTVNVSGGVFKY